MAKRTYQQYCPVAEALDVVGERWTLLIVRELLLGPMRYTDLRAALPGMASNLLGDRLAELTEAGVVERIDADGDASARARYALTPAGRELELVVGALARWGMRRLPAPADDQVVRPIMAARMSLLAYARPRHAGLDRFVVEVELDGETSTIVVDGQRAHLHAGPPQREAPDVTLVGPARELVRVRLGETTFDAALATGALELTGSDDAADRFRRLFALDTPPAAISDADLVLVDPRPGGA